MNFLNVGPMELFLILIVALIVFGPNRLPEIGAAVGRGLREFRRAQQEITEELTRELAATEANRTGSPPTAVPPPEPASWDSTSVVSVPEPSHQAASYSNEAVESEPAAEPLLDAEMQTATDGAREEHRNQ